MARHFRDSVSVLVQCYLAVMVSIRSECFDADKIINKSHKIFLPIIYKIKNIFSLLVLMMCENVKSILYNVKISS